MGEYGKAIGFSISSAQIVFTIAEDTKSFVGQLDKSTKPEEIRPFLTGLANLANEGLLRTGETLAAFRDVRKTIFSVSSMEPKSIHVDSSTP